MTPIFSHWFNDRRTVYVDPNGDHKPERRSAWSKIGPGQAFLYGLAIVLVCGGFAYAKHVSDKFEQQQARTACLRAALRPIVIAAAKLDGSPELAKAERAYIAATKGLRVPERCPR